MINLFFKSLQKKHNHQLSQHVDLQKKISETLVFLIFSFTETFLCGQIMKNGDKCECGVNNSSSLSKV